MDFLYYFHVKDSEIYFTSRIRKNLWHINNCENPKIYFLVYHKCGIVFHIWGILQFWLSIDCILSHNCEKLYNNCGINQWWNRVNFLYFIYYIYILKKLFSKKIYFVCTTYVVYYTTNVNSPEIPIDTAICMSAYNA